MGLLLPLQVAFLVTATDRENAAALETSVRTAALCDIGTDIVKGLGLVDEPVILLIETQ